MLLLFRGRFDLGGCGSRRLSGGIYPIQQKTIFNQYAVHRPNTTFFWLGYWLVLSTFKSAASLVFVSRSCRSFATSSAVGAVADPSVAFDASPVASVCAALSVDDHLDRTVAFRHCSGVCVRCRSLDDACAAPEVGRERDCDGWRAAAAVREEKGRIRVGERRVRRNIVTVLNRDDGEADKGTMNS